MSYKKISPTALHITIKTFLICGLTLFIITAIGFQSHAQTDKGVGTLTSQDQFQGNIHALIIGISDYANYPDLQYADRDALAFRSLLLSDVFSADSNRVVLLLNEQATQNRVYEALMNLVSFVQEGDRVFIYFSGHGGVEGLSTFQLGYLLTYEASQKNLYLTSFGVDYLNRIVGELSTANKADVYLIVDACHSGKIEDEKFKGLSPVNDYIGRITYGTVMLSSSQNELSLEGSQWGGGRGLFSYYLVNGLAGNADMDDNGMIGLTEIEFYVKSHVKKEAAPGQQNPVITGSYRDICSVDQASPAWESSTPPIAQLAMRDINSKGYEELFLEKLSHKQKILYDQYIAALDKSNIPKDALEFVDYSEADSLYNQLAVSDIPGELEVIFRRKLIAALQDKPQELLDIMLSGAMAYAREDEACRMAANLHRSAELMGKSHYLFNITMAKYHYFLSFCYLFNENYENDLNLKILCLNEADSAIALAPDIPMFYNDRGMALSNLKRHEEAITMYDMAIALNPGNANYYANKGNTLRDLQRYEEAFTMYDMAIALNPENADYYSNMGTALFYLQRYEEAIDMYSKAIILEPDSAELYNNKAAALTYLRQYEEAIRLYERCIELNRENEIVYYYNIGCLYSMQNDSENALLSLEQALAKGYSDFNWIRQDTDWDNIREMDEFKALIEKYEGKQ
jgi:protein O-mannosyl-transferase